MIQTTEFGQVDEDELIFLIHAFKIKERELLTLRRSPDPGVQFAALVMSEKLRNIPLATKQSWGLI